MDHSIAFFRSKQERRQFELYVTDALMAIADNFAKVYGGSTMKKRYAEVLAEVIDMHTEQEETRTANDIITGIKNRLNNLGG